MSRSRIVLAALAALLAAGPPAARAEEPPPPKAVTRVVLLTAHDQPVKTWSPMPVRVRVEGADGTPLPGRLVSFWDDSYERWFCCGPPYKHTTDANGEAGTTLHLDGNGLNSVRVAVIAHGTETHSGGIAEWYQPMVGYTTRLSVTAPASRTSGDPLPVTVSVRRDDPDSGSNGCIDGAVVRLELTGPDRVSAEATVARGWDGSCTAAVDLPTAMTPGDYVLAASTGHAGWSRTDEPATVLRTVRVDWQHRYTDAYGRGTVLLNYLTRDYRVLLADGRDSGARDAGAGMVRTGVAGTVSAWRIDLDHADGAGSARGAFYSAAGAFDASGVLHGAPWALAR